MKEREDGLSCHHRHSFSQHFCGDVSLSVNGDSGFSHGIRAEGIPWYSTKLLGPDHIIRADEESRACSEASDIQSFTSY